MAVAITSTETHPHCDEILGVLAQVVHLDDDALRRLALSWRDTPDVARARDRALRPDTPLILEVLTAFDSIGALFAEDLAGVAEYVTLPAPITALGLKAVRDAIAAAYARPALDPADYEVLAAPWHAVFGDQRVQMPDFGPQHHEVMLLLTSVPRLTCHSHDADANALWRVMLAYAEALDPVAHGRAVESAWQAAIVTGRRRLWFLASRSATESYRHRCARCARTSDESDDGVLAVCLGLVAAMLVRDVLDGESAGVLLGPLNALLPPAAV